MLTAKLGILTAYGLLWTLLAVSFHVPSFLLLLAALVRTSNLEIGAGFQVVFADVRILSNPFAMLTLYFSIWAQ